MDGIVNFFSLIDDFGAFAGIAIIVLIIILALIIAIASSVGQTISLALQKDDAEHLLRSEVASKLKDWKPQEDQLQAFYERELIRDDFCRDIKRRYDESNLVEYLRRVKAFEQAESSLVIAQSERGGRYFVTIWMRFWWRDQWWVSWYGSKKHRDFRFRAFPESWLEEEVWPEIGCITAFHTISYETVTKYFKN